MPEISTKPYLLRALYEWCNDNGYTPYIAVLVDGNTRVPREHVKNGEIVLNISYSATSGLKIDNELIEFNARFNGMSRNISVPVDNVLAIYARENGQGMAFEVPRQPVQENSEEGAETNTDMPPSGPALASVPPATEANQAADPDDNPQPPKKGGRPRLTRVK